MYPKALTVRPSLLSFAVITLFASGVTVFIVYKSNEVTNEIDRLHEEVFIIHNAALKKELGDEHNDEVLNMVRWKTY